MWLNSRLEPKRVGPENFKQLGFVLKTPWKGYKQKTDKNRLELKKKIILALTSSSKTQALDGTLTGDDGTRS